MVLASGHRAPKAQLRYWYRLFKAMVSELFRFIAIAVFMLCCAGRPKKVLPTLPEPVPDPKDLTSPADASGLATGL